MKDFYLRMLSIAMVCSLLFGVQYSVAQQSDQIVLKDISTLQPIVTATFNYAGQTGVSDDRGVITFNYVDGAKMALSHVAYGDWTLSDAEVIEALANGSLFRESITVHLQPVTVIAVRSRNTEKESMSFDHRDKMAHDGGALLTQIPAISTIRKGGNYGFDPVLRGFKYDQLNIVMNGAQGSTAACPNRMDPPTSQMAPNMMDRVEILKGPHALRYGVGFGGTINFVPTPLRFSESLDLYGRVSGGYDSQGNVYRTEGLMGLSGQRYDVGLFGAWSQGWDYKDGNGAAVPAGFKRGSFGVDLGFQVIDNHQLRFSANRNLARDAEFPALPMDLRLDDTWMFSAGHEVFVQNKTLKSWTSTVFGSFVDHRMDNLLKDLDPRMLNASTDAKTRNFGFRTEGAWDFGQSYLYVGADMRMESAKGIRVREMLMGPMAGKVFEDNAWQNGRITKSGLFAEYHLNRNSLQWIFATRLEMNMANAKDVEEEFTETYPDSDILQFNPSFSLGLVQKFEKDVTLGFWLARAQRSASLTERYINYFPVGQDPYELLGNPMLKAEANHQFDLTFEWRAPGIVINVDYFFAYLNNYISSVIDEDLSPRLPMSPGVRQYVNLDHVIKTGLEVSFAQELFAGLHHQLAFAYTYGQDLVRDDALPEIAPFDLRYELSGSYLDDRLRPSVGIRYVTRQQRISSEFGETKSPAFTLLNIELSYQFHKVFGMSAGIDNLLDKTYYEHLNRSVRGTADAINAPGRNYYVSFSLNFMD